MLSAGGKREGAAADGKPAQVDPMALQCGRQLVDIAGDPGAAGDGRRDVIGDARAWAVQRLTGGGIAAMARRCWRLQSPRRGTESAPVIRWLALDGRA